MRCVYIDAASNEDINVPKDGATDFSSSLCRMYSA